MYKSTDGGGTWANIGLTSVGVLAIDPSTPQTVYAGTQGDGVGVYKSTAGGDTWAAANTGLPSSSVFALAIDPSTPQTVYAATFVGVYKSTDSGGTWASVNTGLTTSYVISLAIDPSTPHTIYAGTYNGGVFKSTDGGGTWANIGLTNSIVGVLAIDPSTPQTIYAGASALYAITLFNRPPILDPIGAQTAIVGVSLSLTLSATDADGDALTFAVTGNPAGSSLADGVFTWTPTDAQSGDHDVTFTVDDGRGGMASKVVTITVPPPEGPITLDSHLAPGDQGHRTAGDAQPGHLVYLQLNVADGPKITGWSAKIEYDPGALRYVGGSFTVSDLIPSLIGLVDDKTGLVSVGGSILGNGEATSGDGTLGHLAFEVLSGLQGETELHIIEVSFRRTDGMADKRTVRATATITSDLIDIGLSADFNGDGGVDFDDFFIFADGFGGSDPLVDLDRSGTVDFDDFFIFADQFGQEERAKLMALAETYLGLPRETTLLGIYPNPFNASTVINYSLSAPANVRLDIYDLAGQRIDTLVNGLQIAGGYHVRWSSADVSSGVYVVRLRIGKVVRAQKVTLIK